MEVSILSHAAMDVTEIRLALADAGNGGLDASYVAATATIATAAIAALVAIFIHFLGQRKTVRDRKRETCAQALTHALAWMELPYRIRRRVDDNPQTLSALADRAHDLQESLLFHLSWLEVEMPQTYTPYRDLVSAVRSASEAAIVAAWEAAPVSSPAQMNIGDLGINRSEVDQRVSELVQQVRRELSLRRLLFGF